MLLDHCIDNRCSVRKYKKEIPANQLIYQIFDSARNIPSPSNLQPVCFINIKSDDIKNKLKNALENRYNELINIVNQKGNPNRVRNNVNYYWRYSKFMFDAPVIFAVGTKNNLKTIKNKLSEQEIIKENNLSESSFDIAVGIAIQTFSLKAFELGLGSCILTAPLCFVNEKIDNILNLENINIKCFITLGYPDEDPSKVNKKSIDEIYWEI
jgi:nitroreductase